MDRGRLLPFSSRNWLPTRLGVAFAVARAFVSSRWPAAKFVRLKVGCPEIESLRRSGQGAASERALMHVGHLQGTVCASAAAGNQVDAYLFGLFLHEFGHLGSGGGERDADQWILDEFGVRILYDGPLDLERVDQDVVTRIIRVAKRAGLDLKHNPPPRR